MDELRKVNGSVQKIFDQASILPVRCSRFRCPPSRPTFCSRATLTSCRCCTRRRSHSAWRWAVASVTPCSWQTAACCSRTVCSTRRRSASRCVSIRSVCSDVMGIIGCDVSVPKPVPFLCSHLRAVQFFRSSLNPRHRFVGRRCDMGAPAGGLLGLLGLWPKLCASALSPATPMIGDTDLFGIYTQRKRGVFELRTTGSPPFCIDC